LLSFVETQNSEKSVHSRIQNFLWSNFKELLNGNCHVSLGDEAIEVLIERTECFNWGELVLLDPSLDEVADVFLPDETVFDEVFWSWNLGWCFNSKDFVEFFKINHSNFIFIHNIEEFLEKWGSNLGNGLDTKDHVTKTDHAGALWVAHLKECNISELLLHHGVSDFLAHLDNLGGWNVNCQILWVEFVSSVELGCFQSLSIVLEESIRLDVDEAGTKILNSNITVLIDINVLGKVVEGISWSLFVYLHLKEVGEFLTGDEVGGRVLQPSDKSINRKIVGLEEELNT